jgi:hypothetical protein
MVLRFSPSTRGIVLGFLIAVGIIAFALVDPYYDYKMEQDRIKSGQVHHQPAPGNAVLGDM